MLPAYAKQPTTCKRGTTTEGTDMSSNEDTSVNQVLETVTSTIRSLVNLVDTAVATVKKNNESIDGLVKVTQAQDAQIRTLQSQVYALKEEGVALGLQYKGLLAAFNAHYHEDGNA